MQHCGRYLPGHPDRQKYEVSGNSCMIVILDDVNSAEERVKSHATVKDAQNSYDATSSARTGRTAEGTETQARHVFHAITLPACYRLMAMPVRAVQSGLLC
eukprot:jgi/Ulvmu1/719/UM010_0091.1